MIFTPAGSPPPLSSAPAGSSPGISFAAQTITATTIIISTAAILSPPRDAGAFCAGKLLYNFITL